MKRMIFFLIATIGIICASMAQSVYSFTNATLTNLGTQTLTSPKMTGDYDLVFIVKATNVSGTTNCKGELQASLDNSTWTTINADADTAHLTNGLTYRWSLTSTPYTYYRIKFTGWLTQSTTVSGKCAWKPKQGNGISKDVAYVCTNDTITNSIAANIDGAKVTGNGDMAFVYTLTQLSGTTAGSAYLQGSIDGTTWATDNSQTTKTNTAATTFSFTRTSTPDMYYRIYPTGGGTQSTKVAAA